jgi:hypothetical protein
MGSSKTGQERKKEKRKLYIMLFGYWGGGSRVSYDLWMGLH